MKKLNRTIILLILIFVFFFLLGGERLFQPNSDVKSEYEYLSLFSKVVSLVKTDYVDDIDAGEKFPGAFSGMLSALDPYSAYLDRERTQMYQSYLEGRFFGPGIYGLRVDNYFVVTDVLPDSPAEKAGLLPGNKIKSIDGQSLFTRSYWEMYLALLSTEARPIRLGLFQKSSREQKFITVDTIPWNPATTVEQLDKGVTHIELRRFDNACLLLLQEEFAKPVEGKRRLLIDLRRYAGGDPESFRKIANLFFNHPVSLTLKRKGGEDVFLLGGQKVPPYDAVVIINKSTKFYGELLAAMFAQASQLKTAANVNPKAGSSPNTEPQTAPVPPYGNIHIVGSGTTGFVAHLKLIPFDDGSSILLTEGLFLLDGKKVAGNSVKPHAKMNTNQPKLMEQCIALFDKPDRDAGKRPTQMKTKTNTTTEPANEIKDQNNG